MTQRIDTRLRHYRAAVQHPQAEARFAEKAWLHHHHDPRGRGELPLLLREDFAGTASVAAMWVLSHPDRQAVAVEIDEACQVLERGEAVGGKSSVVLRRAQM